MSSPCKNGATCVDLYKNFTCKCAQNFTGSTCEDCIIGNVGPDCSEVFDGCKTFEPCQNGGTCRNVLTNDLGYECDCPGGWIDSKCTTRIDPCGK